MVYKLKQPDLGPFASLIPEVNKAWGVLSQWFSEKSHHISRMELLYRATENGFTAESFHSRCDDSNPTATLTFVLSEHGKTFGAFSSIPW